MKIEIDSRMVFEWITLIGFILIGVFHEEDIIKMLSLIGIVMITLLSYICDLLEKRRGRK